MGKDVFHGSIFKSRSAFGQMMRILWCVFLLSSLLLGFAGGVHAQAGRDAVHVLEVRGVINPPIASYLQRSIENADRQGARLVVIKLDTPGGLDSSTRQITQAILRSPVPVVVFVEPPGARAASAGFFMLMSAHVAAMAPGTNTGAATPVGLGGDDPDETLMAKAVSDAAATMRALAEERGRNADWAERAVIESVSVTQSEALELDVIDLVARDMDDLLRQLDGKVVETSAGEITLSLADTAIYQTDMTFPERFLHVISDPNIAFVLLSLGTIGIIAELYNPGALVPGITGVIALILAFFSLGNLPTNWAGVALVGLAVVLFVAELATEGTGVLGAGAVVAFLLGGLMLFQPFQTPSPTIPALRVNPWLLGGMTASMGAFVLVVMTQVFRSRRAPVMTGAEGFAGRVALVYHDLSPRGRVRFESQLWLAEVPSGRHVPAGSRVRVVGKDRLTLLVEPLDEPAPED